MPELSEFRITHVRVAGFRSLHDVRVRLGDLTVLVGPNGAGKSTFLDALAFVQEALLSSPGAAFASRGGVDQVQARTAPEPAVIALACEVELREPGLFRGVYEVKVRPRPRLHTFTVEEEAATVASPAPGPPHRFVVRRGRWVELPDRVEPVLAWNRLALPLLSGMAHFAPLYRAMTALCFYATDPHVVATPNAPAEVGRLAPDGSNAANVLQKLQTTHPALYQTVVQWMGLIVPGITDVRARRRQGHVTIAFDEAGSAAAPVTLEARVMSEGTLRALAVLLALYQAEPPTLIGLEEPEQAIYPGTAAVLADILGEASLSSQVLVTTQSADLLDHLDPACLRVVRRAQGQTQIASVDATQQDLAREGLFSLGELHRLAGLHASVPVSPADAPHG